MIRLLGTTGRAVQRRWARLDRFTSLDLEDVTLHLAERTGYRPAAQILDLFERATLGGFYQNPDGFDGLTLASSGVVSVAVDTDVRLETYARVLPRDQWAEVRILDATAGLPSGSRAAVGVGLRWSPPSGSGRGYLILVEHTASGDSRQTTVVRYESGVVAGILAAAAHPWQIGDVLRAEAAYQKVRVYRNGTLILDLVDSDPILVEGRAAISVVRADSSDAASLTDFMAGPLRQEYAGAVADMGDVSASLGLLEPTASPAAWDLSLINLAAMGGADRFAALLRHGLNDALGTYDWPRAVSKVWTELEDGSGPLVVATGKLEGMGGMTEDRVRLAFRGRDAFLELFIEPGEVNYLPGDDPLLTEAPIGDDPCGTDDDPEVVPGDPPDEPDPEEDGDGDGGTGPVPPEEPEPEEPPDDEEALPGFWVLFMGRGFDVEESPPDVTEIVFPSEAVQISLDAGELPDYAPADATEASPPSWFFEGFAGSSGNVPVALRVMGMKADPGEADNAAVRLRYVAIYRGPDVSGSTLTIKPGYSAHDIVRITAGYITEAGSIPNMTIVCRRYDGSGIHSQADLEAIHPASADGSTPSTFPTLLETAKSWNFGDEELPAEPVGGYRVAQGTSGIPSSDSTGPDLFILEFSGAWSAEDTDQQAITSIIFRRTPLGPTQNQRFTT